jgi:hypothetical protein
MGICPDDFMGMDDPIASYLPQGIYFLGRIISGNIKTQNYSSMYLYCLYSVKMGATTPIDEIWRGG